MDTSSTCRISDMAGQARPEGRGHQFYYNMEFLWSEKSDPYSFARIFTIQESLSLIQNFFRVDLMDAGRGDMAAEPP